MTTRRGGLNVVEPSEGFSLPPVRPTGGTEARGLDCVLIGFNDVPFHERALRAKAGAEVSAYYSDIKLNSVILDGRRHNYMDVFNRGLEAATGRAHDLNPFRQPNFAVCYLASFLRRRGLSAEVVNLLPFDRDRLVALLAERPRTVAITTTFYVEAEAIVDLIGTIRGLAPETKIVVGGPYVHKLCTFFDETTQDYLLGLVGADVYINDSQGESSLAALLWALRDGASADLSRVPNLLITGSDGLRRTTRAVEKNALDSNIVDWSLFEKSYLTPTVYMRTARSCAFACSFCSHPAFGGEHVVNELDIVMQQLRELRELGVKNVVFVDDTFNVPLPRFKKLLRRIIEERLELNWMSFFRCTSADEETFELMRASGCVASFLGIESGDPDVLGQMDKHARVERYRDGITRLNSVGIATYASLIVGHPGETQRSVTNTIELIQNTQPTFYFPNLYYHDVRAPIHERAAELCIEGTGYSWSHATMDWREGVASVRRMYDEITNSALCGGYSLSFWGIFYLWTLGFTMPQLVESMHAIRSMVLESIDEREATGIGRLASIVDGYAPQR